MNDLNVIKNVCANRSMHEYGLSPLHGCIRRFECILHIAYRLPIKKWQIRSSDKAIEQQTKLDIQEMLRKEMCLLVYNGNTVR